MPRYRVSIPQEEYEFEAQSELDALLMADREFDLVSRAWVDEIEGDESEA